jgi:hypothetical protein
VWEGFAALAGLLSLAKTATVQPHVKLERPLSAATFDLEAALCSHGLFMVTPIR